MIRFEDLQCSITRDPVMNAVNMFFYAKGVDGRIHVVKPMEFQLEPQDEYASVTPSIRLPGTSGESLLRAIAEALDKQGIKTDSDAKIAGTLEATKHHLEDMRGLLAWFTQQDDQNAD